MTIAAIEKPKRKYKKRKKKAAPKKAVTEVPEAAPLLPLESEPQASEMPGAVGGGDHAPFVAPPASTSSSKSAPVNKAGIAAPAPVSPWTSSDFAPLWVALFDVGGLALTDRKATVLADATVPVAQKWMGAGSAAYAAEVALAGTLGIFVSAAWKEKKQTQQKEKEKEKAASLEQRDRGDFWKEGNGEVNAGTQTTVTPPPDPGSRQSGG
jgi:hypothetical protein